MAEETKPIPSTTRCEQEKADNRDGSSLKQNGPSEFHTRSILTLIGSALSAFCTVGFTNAFGIFLDYYHRHQLSDRSEFDITWIGSFSTFALFLFFAPAGLLVDRMGPTFLLVAGGIVTLFSVFMISLCTRYYQFFLAQGVLLGIGQAFLTCPGFAVVSRYFHKSRGIAMGIAIAGSSLGGIIWPVMMDQLLNRHGLSFGWTVRIVAFTMLPLVAIACATIRPPAADKSKNEENSATLSDQSNEKKKKKTDLSILRNRTYLTFTTGLGVFYLSMFSPFFFATTYAVSLGLSTSFAFYLTSILNGASLVGRISAGWIADRYGYFNLCSLAALTSSVVAFCWTKAQGTAGLVVWSLAYGFACGSIMSLQTTCGTKLATPETYGTAVGMAMGIVSLSGLFGSPISGELIKYSYLALSMYVGAAMLVGALFVIAARLQLSRKLFDVV